MQDKILKELEHGFCDAYKEYLQSAELERDYKLGRYQGYFNAFLTALKAAGVEKAEEGVCYKLCDKVLAELNGK